MSDAKGMFSFPFEVREFIITYFFFHFYRESTSFRNRIGGKYEFVLQLKLFLSSLTFFFSLSSLLEPDKMNATVCELEKAIIFHDMQVSPKAEKENDCSLPIVELVRKLACHAETSKY